MRHRVVKLEAGDSVHVYSKRGQVVLQIRRDRETTPKTLLEPSFKCSVEVPLKHLLALFGELSNVVAQQIDVPEASGVDRAH